MDPRNQVQLITYPDSLGGDLEALYEALTGPLAGLFGGVHILPFYPSSGDRGFAPVSYDEVEPRFGSWEDIRRIGPRFDLAADVMVNHLSRNSPYFQDFSRLGRRSEYADLFLTLDKIWPDGNPPPADVERIFLRKPGQPFSDIRIESTGEIERLWTTFGTREWSEQIDLDVRSPDAQALLRHIARHLAGQGVKLLRLDAVGYVVKKPGTSCFFVEPEIYGFLDWMRDLAHSFGLEILPEIHAEPALQSRLAAHGFWVYDFVLPLLILHTLLSRSSRKLKDYLRVCPRRQFTMLDCHDGIPVQPDLDGILTIEESRAVVDRLLGRGANVSRILSAHHDGKGAEDFDAHQVNCTYYSALGGDDDSYLAARAVQFFAPGIPQLYYVGLLAGENDRAAMQATGEGRAINRHNYTPAEIDRAVGRPVVRRLMRLIRFRNTHPAFDGDLAVLDSDDGSLHLQRLHGESACTLHLDLRTAASVIEYQDGSHNPGYCRV